MDRATITELHYHPVKSCAGISVRDGLLTPAGLAHDRSFMIVGPGGTCRTQRRDPRLALIRPEISTDGDQLVLRASGVGKAHVDVDLTAPRREVTLFGTVCNGIDQGDDVADWITEVLRVPSRLVRVPPEQHRVTDGLTPGTSAYADSCPVHVISSSSVGHLNERIVERGGHLVPMNRFRPNIVIDGWAEPHREDGARRVVVGDTELGYAKLAIRCVTTTVDQETGTKRGPEPLRTLADYRRAPDGGVAIGTKFAVLRPGKLTVGDELVVTDWGAPEM
ncbi:MOSC domain-containing protein [Saccharothrix sp. ALI-22-I]|uniref:MOSC domain-containing protein n=1 Tax=Saccharothrix sp. ALI-22-I TaxID=1933778 RepID=UPI00097C1E07|nr:MOSC N-terminal beta barrel domain-containing protein [Saccharothrix sp. ALI-22-I]ONI85158.1 MOSC domain-containing protein [Saccharothrix sp. ALI-22-I]